MENEVSRVARKLKSLDWPMTADDEETLWRRRAALAIAAVNGDKEPPPADPAYFLPGDLECGCHGHEWACANRKAEGFTYDPGLGRFGLHRRLSKGEDTQMARDLVLGDAT
jgi:hypothetical protein